MKTQRRTPSAQVAKRRKHRDQALTDLIANDSQPNHPLFPETQQIAPQLMRDTLNYLYERDPECFLGCIRGMDLPARKTGKPGMGTLWKAVFLAGWMRSGAGLETWGAQLEEKSPNGATAEAWVKRIHRWRRLYASDPKFRAMVDRFAGKKDITPE